LEMPPAEFERVTAVNYLGTVYGTLAALRRMRRRDRGTIIQIGSALAYRAIPLQSAYCASKFAIRGFTDALRTELIHDHSPDRPDNLFHSVPGDHAAAGPFPDRATGRSLQLWARTHQPALAAGGLAALAAGAAALAALRPLGRRSRPSRRKVRGVFPR